MNFYLYPRGVSIGSAINDETRVVLFSWSPPLPNLVSSLQETKEIDPLCARHFTYSVTFPFHGNL